MNKFDIKDYSLEVKKLSDEDGGGYIAKIVEFDCIGDGDTVEDAIADVYEVAEAIIELAKIEGKKIPRPIQYKDELEYSGKFTIRLPKKMHKRLSEEAEVENCSLNSLLLTYISYGMGRSEVEKSKVPKNIFSNYIIDSVPVPVSETMWKDKRGAVLEPILFSTERLRNSKKSERC